MEKKICSSSKNNFKQKTQARRSGNFFSTCYENVGKCLQSDTSSLLIMEIQFYKSFIAHSIMLFSLMNDFTSH
jgi:hypothetical protein